SADLTANTITLDDTFNDTTKEGAETVGFRLTNDSAGTFSVAGTGNAVTAVSKLVKNGTGPFEGQVEIGGTMMPMGRLQAVPMPTYKNYDARD
ncbi:MAG TPA: hypothetical protein VF171_04640, partial [Trueperaceae bacterium]